MTYYYAQGLLIEASDGEDLDEIYVQELLSNAELSEINLAIAISDAIEKRIESVKKASIPSNPIPKKPIDIKSSSASSPGDMFKLTGTSASSSSSSGPKQYTPLSTDALHAKKDKLAQLESELSEKVAKIREEQEKRTRSMAPELAQKMIEKRKKALAVQQQAQATAKAHAKSVAAKKTATKKK